METEIRQRPEEPPRRRVGASWQWHAALSLAGLVTAASLDAQRTPEVNAIETTQAGRASRAPRLNAVVTLRITDSTIAYALDEVARQAGLRIVYNNTHPAFAQRIRANVTRTPEQAKAVDWAKVIDDAENGITTNFMVNSGGSTGWNVGMNTQRYQDVTWGQMSMMYSGMADVSGNYANFIAQSYQNRNGMFLVVTPDKRWPQGTTRAAQNAASPKSANDKLLPYIENRTSEKDVTGDPWGVSQYTYHRWRYIRENSGTGLFPEFMKAEVDLLAAEGYIRTGNIAKAAEKIDLSRNAIGGLPKLAGVITSATQPVPGGAECVPQVPQGNGTVACGNIMEAMKYEKRIETQYSAFGRWWTDGRGWGDLIEGTPLEFPVPYQEMQVRLQTPYLLGPGFGSAAAKGIYGF